MSHHDLCTTCAKVCTDHTPAGFPAPGEVAESITRENPSWIKTHRLIAEAIAERDRLWCEKVEPLCAKAAANAVETLG